MNAEPVTTYLVKVFWASSSEDEPYADMAAATERFEELERAFYNDDESSPESAYLYAVTGDSRVLLRTFDRGYDEYLKAASVERYKCIYCGHRSRSDDTAGFYCYAGPRGEHHYELVDGDE